jgi:hypothetical protein
MAYDPANTAHRTELAEALKALLERSGFVKTLSAGEDIYEFKFPKLAHTRVLVYTTVVNGVARGDGEDAIRVAAVYTTSKGQQRGLFKDTRVNRTGEIEKIVERTLGRMRNAYTALNKRSAEGKVCNKCGSPLFTAKSGKEVCAEACWTAPKAAIPGWYKHAA